MELKIVLHDAENKHWLSFENPIEILQADKIQNVLQQLETVQNRVEQEKLYAAGFVSYEAASAFDPALKTYPPDNFPLIWFGIYHEPEVIKIPESQDQISQLNWQPQISEENYISILDEIKNQLRDGNTYQVNFTFPLRSKFNGDPWAYFLKLIHNHQTDYGAYLEFDNYAIASFSPEQFFILDGNQICSSPMKGTRARGRYLAEDIQIKNELFHSAKDRAENIMIVDMIRNDLSRIADYGTVKVEEKFKIEKYSTVWQMISKVTAKTNATIPEIFKALFPCASITGAPKVNTMKIINSLEKSPRRIYTGCIGFISPGRKAQFNVAIRTVLIDKNKKKAEYGVGGGIVWDSIKEKEYDECFIKARTLMNNQPVFQLLESILWSKEEGFFILDYHLKRMRDSAAYFNYKFERDKICKALNLMVQSLENGSFKIRLLLNQDGSIEIQSNKLNMETYSRPLKVCLAKNPVNSDNIFLFHKTTYRDVYDQIKNECPDCDELLLYNERDEITEFTNANVLVKIEGQFYTPPVTSGLLGGTFRQYLLDQKKIKEKIITKEMLNQSEEIVLINSVRKYHPVRLMAD